MLTFPRDRPRLLVEADIISGSGKVVVEVPRKSNTKLREAFGLAHRTKGKSIYFTGDARWGDTRVRVTEAEKELRQEIAAGAADSAAYRARQKKGSLVAPMKAIALDTREIVSRLQTLQIGTRGYRNLMKLVALNGETLKREAREATQDEMAAHLMLSAKQIEALLRVLPLVGSFDNALAAEVYEELAAKYADVEGPSPSDFPSPLEEAARTEERERTTALLTILTPVERDAVLRERGDKWTKSRQTTAVSRHRAIERMRDEARQRGWKVETPAPPEQQPTKWGPEHLGRQRRQAPLRRDYRPGWRERRIFRP